MKKREPLDIKGDTRLPDEGYFTFKFRRAKEKKIIKEHLKGFWV